MDKEQKPDWAIPARPGSFGNRTCEVHYVNWQAVEWRRRIASAWYLNSENLNKQANGSSRWREVKGSESGQAGMAYRGDTGWNK